MGVRGHSGESVSICISFDLGICIFLYFLVFLHNGHISVYIFASICVCIIYLGGQPLEWGDHSGDRVLICIYLYFGFYFRYFCVNICVCIIYLGGPPLEWGDHSGDRVCNGGGTNTGQHT